MSRSEKQFDEMGHHSLPTLLQDACNLDENKPDFKELDLGTPSVLSGGTAAAGSAGGDGSVAAVHSNNKNPNPFGKRLSGSGGFNTSHSGELLNASNSSMATTPENLGSGSGSLNRRPGHRRSYSTGAPLIYSGSATSHFNSTSTSTSTSSNTTTNSGSGGGSGGVSGGSSGSSVSSPNSNLYPSGNICPSGKILKSNMNARSSTSRTEKLGLGTGNYGHGSIIKGGNAKLDPNAGEMATILKKAMMSSDAEEVKNAGNELHKRGNYAEALTLYDRSIAISPENAACRSNRAAALTMLGRFGEAVRECEEAVRLNPGFQRAHQRLASLYLRLGQVERARHHLSHAQQNDMTELQKLNTLEKHINRCSDARKIGDWKGVLRECEAAMLAGAVSSPQIIACKAEAFLKLQQLENADSTLSDIPKLEPYPVTCSQIKFFGILSEAYVLYVRAQVDMALGRFESAAAFAEKAFLIDYGNIEVAMLLNNVKLVTRARAHGRDLFNSGRFSEACSAYGEGLKYNLSNAVLHCNRAVCWSKLGLWEKSVEDCNLALKIQPNYTKALLRRAASNAKLERWGEAVRDYEVLRKELPGDTDVAESLSRAQDALRKSSRGEPSGPDHIRTLKSSSGGSGAESQPKSSKSWNH